MLTARQKRFCEEYLHSKDAEGAFRRAGYREKNAAAGAARLLAVPAVSAYLRDCEAALRAAQVADATEILRFLTGILRGEHGSDRERMRAAELLGKRMGLFEDSEQAVPPTVVVVDDMPS